MFGKLITNLSIFIKKPFILPFFLGFLTGVVLFSSISAFAFLGSYYGQYRIKRFASSTAYKINESVNADQQSVTNDSFTQSIQTIQPDTNYRPEAVMNQEKWDTAKKTGNFKDLMPLLQSSYGEKPQVGDCIDNIDPKHNPNIEIKKISIKNPQNGDVSGQFNANYIIGIKDGSAGAGKGSDIIGFNLEFVCQKYNPKYSLADSFGRDGFIKVDCSEILFLSEKFRKQLNPDSCLRMKDNASFWLFRDTSNVVEYDWNFIGAKEIKDTLQLEIDLK